MLKGPLSKSYTKWTLFYVVSCSKVIFNHSLLLYCHRLYFKNSSRPAIYKAFKSNPIPVIHLMINKINAQFIKQFIINSHRIHALFLYFKQRTAFHRYNPFLLSSIPNISLRYTQNNR